MDPSDGTGTRGTSEVRRGAGTRACRSALGLLLAVLAVPAGAGATGTTNGRAVFSNSTTTPQHSPYAASTNTFTAGASAVAGGTPTFVVNRSCPARTENVAGYLTTGGVLYVVRWNGTAWSNEWNVTVGGDGVNGRRFDIAYEALSGRAMVVYSTNATGTAGNEMAYRVWDGTSWTAAATIDSALLNQAAAVTAVKLASRPQANELALAAQDSGTTTANTSDLTSFVWNGTAWGSEPASLHDTSMTNTTGQLVQYDNFGLAYEALSGHVVVVWSRQAAAYNGYRVWDGAAWGAVTAMPGTARAALQTYVVGNPRTNQVLAVIHRSAFAGVYGYVWDGGAWSGQQSLSTTVNTTGANKMFVTGQWLNVAGAEYGVPLWVTTTAGTIGYNVYTGGAWGAAATNATGFAFAHQWLHSDADPFVPDTMLLSLSYTNGTNFLQTRRLVLTAGPTYTWTTPTNGNLTTALPNVTTQCFGFTYDRKDPTAPAAGTVTVAPTVGIYTSTAPTITTTFTESDSPGSGCEYTVDGGTNWLAGMLSGSAPSYTCTASPTGLSGSLTVNMRMTSGGGTGTATAVTRTVDATGPTDGTLTATPGTEQVAFTWTAATDSGSGLRPAATYDLRYLPGPTPPTCATGTSLYAGTGLAYTHTSLTPEQLQHSYRLCAYDAFDNVSAGATQTVTPLWSAVTTSCGRCHGYPPLDGSVRGTPAGAVIGDHQKHLVACSTCHVVPATQTSADYYHRNGQIEMLASIRGGTYSRGTSFTQANNATTGTCSTVGCHGANSPTPRWGTGAVGCVDCHAGTLTRTAAAGTLDNVVAEFNPGGTSTGWSHKRSAGYVVTDADCIVCHLEGDSTTQATSAMHMDGNIDLRDPDGATREAAITDMGGAAFTFQKFATSYAAATRYTDGHTRNTVDNVITQKFCLKCHDANGATNPGARVAGGTQYKPFNTTIAGAGYVTPLSAGVAGGVVDVDSQFATTNKSLHPIKAPLSRDYPTPARLNAPYNNFTRTAGTVSNGVVLNCFDCHNVPGASPLTARTVSAHGNAATLRGLSQIPAPNTVPTATTNEVTLCKVCHYQYDTQTQPTHGTGSATGSLQRPEKISYMRYGCTRCHSGGYFAPPARPKRGQDVHGYSATWPAAPALAQTAFIRNTDTMDSHQPRSIGGTAYTPNCVGMFGGGPTGSSCSETGPGNGRTETYSPGGTY